MSNRIYQFSQITFIVLCISSKCYAEPELTIDEIRNYVEHALVQLLASSSQYDKCVREDINTIKERVLTLAIQPSLWERLCRAEIKRTPDDLQEIINTVIIGFVEQKSYNLAFRKINNAYIASKVSKNMRNFVEKRIKQVADGSSSGALSRFVGQRLQEAVNEQSQRYDTIQETDSIKLIKCRICSGKCVESDSVSLSPCKHCICKKCAHEHFFAQQQSPRCTYCAKSIDLNDLHEKLYAPSIQPVNQLSEEIYRSRLYKKTP